MSYNNNENIPLAKLCYGKGEYGIGASAVPKNPNLPTYLRITDITDNGDLITEGLTSVDHTDSSKYYLEENDIVFARTGASTGRAFFYEKKYGRLVYAGFLIKFSIDEKKVNPKYLKYYTISDQYKGWVKAYTGGSTRGNINAKTFGDMLVAIPPRNQQDFLVKILSSFDDKIELNNKINKNLEELAQTLYKRWFVDFEFPNGDGEPYKTSGGEMVESELGLIPKGWSVLTLKDRFAFERGIEPGSKNYNEQKTTNSVAFYRVGDLDQKSNVFVDKIIIKNKVVNERDVLVSFDGAIGRVGIGFEGSYSTGLRKVYDKNKHISEAVIYFIMKSDSIQDTMRAHANGTTILHAGSSIPFLKIPFNIDILNAFDNKISSLFYKLIQIIKENKKLVQTRDELLPKLMNGEIEVPIEE